MPHSFLSHRISNEIKVHITIHSLVPEETRANAIIKFWKKPNIQRIVMKTV